MLWIYIYIERERVLAAVTRQALPWGHKDGGGQNKVKGSQVRQTQARQRVSQLLLTVMNTPKSMALGWGGLIAAAGVGYYYARKDINERRRKQAALGTRPTEKLDWQARVEQGVSATQAPVTSDGVPRATSTAASPDPPDGSNTKK